MTSAIFTEFLTNDEKKRIAAQGCAPEVLVRVERLVETEVGR